MLNRIKDKKLTIIISIFTFIMVLFISYLKLDKSLMNQYRQEYVLITSCLYFIFILLWYISIRYRVIEKDTKRYISYICYLMIFFVCARTLKWYLINHAKLQIFFWYTYYIPIILMPEFLLIISIRLNKNQYKKYFGKLNIIRTISTFFIIFILTNDYHGFVFKIIKWFPTCDIIEHLWGFYIVYFYIVILYALSIFFIVKNSIVPETNTRIKFPLFMMALYIIYTILYKFFPAEHGIGYIELTLAICVIIGSIIESLIQSRLIPSNSGYKMILENIDIPILIVDDDYNTIYRSKNDFLLDKSEYKNINNTIINDNKFSSKKLNKGHILWSSDVSNINKKIDEIKATSIEIGLQNEELQKQLALEEKELGIKQRNKLYQNIEIETKTKQDKLYSLINQKRELSKNELIEACLLATYIKRISNIILISQSCDKLNALELESAILESLSTYEIKNKVEHSENYIDFSLDLEIAKNIYEYFENELEFYISSNAELKVTWDLKDSLFYISIQFTKENIEFSNNISEYLEFFKLNDVEFEEVKTRKDYKINFYINEEKDV